MKNYNFKAVIFDLDGVITKTALVHSAAWKKMFDEYLKQRADKLGEKFIEFSHEKDYLPFVDGKPRYKGVESFLQSRNIKLPFGYPDDDPGKQTICGLGNRKNQAFNEVLDRDGVEVYESTVGLMKELRGKGIRVGVASSSKNCRAVLEKAGLLEVIETRVDGVVSAEIGLQGKPEPDIFTTAADNLGVPFDQAVVVEDAVSGVQAGRKGNFGFVLGIARENNTKELKTNGADIVVKDISEIGFEGINQWFEQGLDEDNWSLTYSDYAPEKEKSRETMLTVGNGYFGTRGAMEETNASEFNYPGTYIAGLYNRLTSKVGDRDVENEDFVNSPNWLEVRFNIGLDDPVDINLVEILKTERKLDFKTGLLTRSMIIRDENGRETKIVSQRFASMENPHIAAMSYAITPLNYSGHITLETGLNGAIINDGVARYRQLNQQHLKPVLTGGSGNISHLVVETTQSAVKIAVASKFEPTYSNKKINPDNYFIEESGAIYSRFGIHVEKGKSLKIKKVVSIYTSLKWDSEDPLKDAMSSLESTGSFDDIYLKSKKKWAEIWDKIDIKIEGDRLAQKLLRLHLYHLMVSLAPNNSNIDASITARGLHGEAYRGHIFWDELFILPLYNLHFKDVAKSALMYRYRRLDEARKYAKEYGYKGAMFPWQSGSNGREETQVIHLNPVSGKWGPDYSSYQRHVSLAIAYNVWQYFHVTEDVHFMEKFGAEMLFEICRFWASKSKLNTQTGRYEINNVMGPDEFHEKYPGSEDGGLKDNTYTNLMVVWMIGKALATKSLLTDSAYAALCNKINLSDKELSNWKDIAAKMNVVIENDILSQYDGYFDLKELDWDFYREKYENIYRLDRLLKAEGKSVDDFKVAKQADTLQTFYNLDESEVTQILENLNYQLSSDYLSKNLEYYLRRTSHGSTLSRVVHAQLANMINDKKLSWELYQDALTSDYNDIQGGTTGEGIHAGVMAGTVLIALQSYAGLNLKGDDVKFEPNLPKHWRTMQFGFDFKGVRYKCKITHEAV
ncbi:MAG: beta-phosphoglucomutase family hydrolase, partial [Bacteroidales bacterium]|nr:beta-phosphoglucomutase family hydrolase [Bacteroidales bacterium]